MIELISIHIPKTAGRSFRAILQNVYGKDKVFNFNVKDTYIYQHNVKETCIKITGKKNLVIYKHGELKHVIPSGTRVIHGHFKFADIKELREETDIPVIAWLRDPLERVISNYYFVLRKVRSGERPDEYHRRNETLIEYANQESARNRMSKFLDGISLKDILFAGITEHFSDDIMDLAGLLGWKNIELEYRNINKEFRSKFKPVSAEVREEIKRLNRRDIELYQEAVHLRQLRYGERTSKRSFSFVRGLSSEILGKENDKDKVSADIEDKKNGKALIFLHIPKTGGMTLYQVINRQFPGDQVFDISRENEVDFKNLSDKEKAGIKCLKGHMRFGLHQYLPSASDYITVLRDPVDRVVSQYFHGLSSQGKILYKKITSDNMNLQDFVNSDIGILYNQQTRIISGDVKNEFKRKFSGSFTPCLPPEALKIAKRILQRYFKVVGVLERFDETLLILKKTFGWKNIYYLKENVTRKRADISSVPEEVIQIIKEKNRLDIELHKFAEEMLENSIKEYGHCFKRDLIIFKITNFIFSKGLKIKILLYELKNKISGFNWGY